MREFYRIFLLSFISVAVHGQTLTVLLNFDGTNGNLPERTPIQAFDGNLYGTTREGGSTFSGTLYRLSLGGTLTEVFSFCSFCPDGYFPVGGLLQAANGMIYGTTSTGGSGVGGTAFSLTLNGKLTTISNFVNFAGGPDDPTNAFTEGSDGNLYTTMSGGTFGIGSVVKVSLQGQPTLLYSFQATYPAGPGPLVEGFDGNYYGVTGTTGTSIRCGTNGCGTVFKITPQGELTTLVNFNLSNGETPVGALTLGPDGSFYGATQYGGVYTGDFSNGTLFRVTPQGVLTTLHNFIGIDGIAPNGGLVLASDGNFYGITGAGGEQGNTAIFRLTPSGVYTSLHELDSTEGVSPQNGLIQATDGNFYGAASFGGANNDGTIFRFSTGLPPFVNVVPSSQSVGATVKLQGTNLTGATSVTFNGTPAQFTVTSPTVIQAVVPPNATSGTVKVTTPSGTLLSRAPFQVRP